MTDFEDFDGTLTLMLRQFGIPEVDIPLALAAAASEDIGRMSDAQIAANLELEVDADTHTNRALPSPLWRSHRASSYALFSVVRPPLGPF